MELHLPLLLLCVSTSYSMYNETEGPPTAALNISAEDPGWAQYLDGSAVSGFSPEDYAAALYMDGHSVGDPGIIRQVEDLEHIPSFSMSFPEVALDPERWMDEIRIGVPQNFQWKSDLESPGTTLPPKVDIAYEKMLEDLMYLRSWLVTKLVPSIYTAVLLMSLPLNVMAIIMFLVKVKVEKPAVVYLLNLSVADVLFVGILPFHIVYRFSGNNWLVGEVMCRLVTAAFFCNMRGSILLMMSISVDRFLALVYPVRSLPWRTVGRAWFVCLCIWVISLASTTPLLIMQQTRFIPALRLTTCYDIQLEEVFHKFHYYYYFPCVFLLFYLFPILITTSCYIRTICSLSSANIKGAQRRSRAIILSVVVLCVFVLCFGPSNLILLLHLVQTYRQVGNAMYIAYILSLSVSSISCCVDPLIYYYGSSQWQRHVYSLLGCRTGYTAPRKSVPQLQRHPTNTPKTSTHTV